MKCLMCNEHFKAITNSHLQKHSLTIDEYKEKFPNVEMKSSLQILSAKKALKIARKKLDEKIPCRICGQEFTRRGMKYHILWKHNKNFREQRKALLKKNMMKFQEKSVLSRIKNLEKLSVEPNNCKYCGESIDCSTCWHKQISGCRNCIRSYHKGCYGKAILTPEIVRLGGKKGGKIRGEQLRDSTYILKVAFCEVCNKPISYKTREWDDGNIFLSTLESLFNVQKFDVKKGRYHKPRFCSRICRSQWQSGMMNTKRNPSLNSRIAMKRAKYMRKQSTDIEIIVESLLKQLDIPYYSQVVIGTRIVDFLLLEDKVIIECDCLYWHNKQNDKKRDFELLERLPKGFEIIHLYAKTIYNLQSKDVSSLNCLLEKGVVYV